LFAQALKVENIILPKEFVAELEGKDTKPSSDGIRALKMWTMGAGNSANRFNGENPIPAKTEVATKDSWKTLPMPGNNTTISMNVMISREAMDIVKMGHIPSAMEDHWFMYCDDDTIRYYRSWTGICIFAAKYEECGEQYRITELTANREQEQYGSTDDEHDVALFLALLTEEFGGDASEFWKIILK